MSEQSMLLVLAVVVGSLAGLTAVVLKTLVAYSSRLVLHLSADTPHLLVALLPLTGIVLTVVLVRYLLRTDIGHGLPSVLLAISRGHSKLPPRNIYASLLASTVTVAFGGSVGLEAPIASSGGCHSRHLQSTLCGYTFRGGGLYARPYCHHGTSLVALHPQRGHGGLFSDGNGGAVPFRGA